MFQMSRVTFCLLSAYLLVILASFPPSMSATNYEGLNICSRVRCIGVAKEDCPGNYTESDPDNEICCSRCTVTKGEFCVSRRLFTAECLSRCASIEIILSKVSRRNKFTKNLTEDRIIAVRLRLGADRVIRTTARGGN